jgi:hypothetical protein
MNGTVAITDHRWYEFLLAQGGLDEVNFWTPSADAPSVDFLRWHNERVYRAI